MNDEETGEPETDDTGEQGVEIQDDGHEHQDMIDAN